MQAAPVRPVRATAIPSVTDALRAMESLLLGSGQRTARRNAWVGMSVGTARARARREADLAVHRAQLRADARPRRQAR